MFSQTDNCRTGNTQGDNSPAAPLVIAAIVARGGLPEQPGGLQGSRALRLINGTSALEHVARRLTLCSRIDGLIVATGDAEADLPIIDAARHLHLPWLAAFSHDILKRLLLTVERGAADHIIRINGNFPLIDPWALDQLIASHLAKKADYSTNSHYHGLVYGMGAEIISARILREVVEYGPPGDLYSGTQLFLLKPQDFNINLQSAQSIAPYFKTSIDFAGDEKTIEAILAENQAPDNESVVEIFRSRPFLAAHGRKIGEAEVGLSKILLFPEKLSVLKNKGLNKTDLSYPISVELSLTNQCNQNCRWCSDRYLRHSSSDRLDLDILKNLFNDLARGGTRGITIEGGGEPTISHLFEPAVIAAAERGLAVGLITNGLDLLPPERATDIYSKFEWIRVSLDAADRQQYLKMKGVDGFDQILSALGRLAECVAEKTLGVGYVLTNHNDDPDKLQHLVLSLRSIGVNYLQIRPVVDHRDLVSHQPLDFLKKFETSDFSVNLTALSENQAGGNASLPCLAHSLSTVIGADGAVWICGRLNMEPTAEPMGDLTISSFHDIWYSPSRAAQAALCASSDWCGTHCPQCRMSKYNLLLSDLDRLKTKNFI